MRKRLKWINANVSLGCIDVEHRYNGDWSDNMNLGAGTLLLSELHRISLSPELHASLLPAKQIMMFRRNILPLSWGYEGSRFLWNVGDSSVTTSQPVRMCMIWTVGQWPELHWPDHGPALAAECKQLTIVVKMIECGHRAVTSPTRDMGVFLLTCVDSRLMVGRPPPPHMYVNMIQKPRKLEIWGHIGFLCLTARTNGPWNKDLQNPVVPWVSEDTLFPRVNCHVYKILPPIPVPSQS
jgi:hypothetical protein